MKTIAIVVDKSEKLAQLLKQNLEKVLEGFACINLYYLKKFEYNKSLDEDLVLAMGTERAIELHNFVENKNRVLVINRTITIEAWLKLKELPINRNFVVVNDYYSTTIEFTEQLGAMFANAKLEPYDSSKIYDEDQSFITPAEGRLLPSRYKNIIDVGHRVIDSSTFIEIITKLEIKNNIVNKRLIGYMREIVALEEGIHFKFKELAEKNQILNTLLRSSRNGLAIIDLNGNFKLYNNQFKEFIDIDEKDIKRGFSHCLSRFKFDKEIENKLLDKTDELGEVYIRNNRYFRISKTELEDNGVEEGYLIVISEITYIKKIEQKLSGKLLKRGQTARYKFEDIISKSQKMDEVINLSKKIALSDYEIIIRGESGTGKELLAQSIHNYSNRKEQAFVAINCAAIPENLLESELFGYEKGSFTGALKEGKKGLFEIAHNGTIFLDEIGDMPTNLQAKLLRVLQEHQISRLGSYEVINIDVRVVAATHRDLKQSIASGDFREDLYYRLNVLPIRIPSLRERREDILLLLETFLESKYELSKEVVDVILKYNWPGNIRELNNVAKYIDLMKEDESLVEIHDLPEYMVVDNDINGSCKITEVEREILYMLKEKYQKDRPTGRTHMIKSLRENNIAISEMKYRKILQKLSKYGYINLGKGRAGTQISKKGEELLG